MYHISSYIISGIQTKMAGKIKNILLVGTGAVGSLYGGKLAQTGVGVYALSRSDYHVTREKGISVASIWGDFHFSPDQVVRHANKLDHSVDVVLVALKVLPEIDIFKIIGPAVSPQTAVVLIQNGVEIEQAVAEAFPENELISGLAFVCVSRLAPGAIQHSDYGLLVLGTYPSGLSEKTAELVSLFQSAGVPCKASENIARERWKKLVWNAPFSPISVLGGGLNTREILEQEESANLVCKVMEEVCSIADSLGHPIPASTSRKYLEDTLRMKPYKTSMYLDFEAGRPMEVEGILGNTVHIARRQGIKVPHLETLYALLKQVDQKRNQNS
ncbi:MAG: 2-dehydropantoate 2-reductase [Planctomycetes bacterium]|nr:2-dehydropantoate 2-reductase [Planctomycetota bacterium]